MKVSKNKRYMIGQMSYGSSYGPYPGDVGLIIPKLLGLGKDDQLLRLGQIREFTAKDTWECGKCGNWFASVQTRDLHFKKRHGDRGPKVKNLDELTDKQRAAFKAEMDGDYYTSPQDFMIGDPEDHNIQLEEKVAQDLAPINWDKTQASRK